MDALSSHAVKTNGQKVTIVTRTKNRPLLLPRAIGSILSQTHEDWHLYIVNDGGECKPVDDLVSIYSSAFQGRITVIHHEQSKGMEAASNAALKVSQSDFIVIHDDDDSWHPEFLEETIKFLQAPENERYAAVVTHCTEVYERMIGNDEILEEHRRSWMQNRQFIRLNQMIQGNEFPPIALLIRRSVVHELGYFNESLPVLGDWDFNLRLMLVGDIGVIPRHLAYYHIRKNADDSTYGNSVTQLNQHQLWNTLYQNSLLRESFQKDISQLGPLALTLRAISDQHWDIAEMKRSLAEQHQSVREMKQAFAHVEWSLEYIHMVTCWIAEALRPLRWIWTRMLPLRRLVGKFVHI